MMLLLLPACVLLTKQDMEDWQDAHPGTDIPFENYTVPTFNIRMIAISAGTFPMGAAGDPDPGDYTDHDVTLTHDFWIGETEITRDQLEAASAFSGWTYTSMSSYPCSLSTGALATASTDDDCPADSISWYDMANYANALSAAEGYDPCYTDNGDETFTAPADPYAREGYHGSAR